MELILKQLAIENNQGKPIKCHTRYSKAVHGRPAVFILHGFKGFKDWGFIPFIAGRIAEAGAIAVTFDFSMNGIEGSSDYVARREDFAENTISRQIDDAREVICYYRDLFLRDAGINWNGMIYLLGHSLGGAISLLIAKEDSTIEKLALWGAISTFDRYTERQKKQWRAKGYLEFVNIKTNQALKLNLSYLIDFEIHKDEFDLAAAAARYSNPLLIVHGAQDMTVPPKEAELLADSYLSTKTGLNKLTKKIIAAAGHTFGIIHPFQSSNKQLDEALECTIDFFGLNE